MVLTVGLFVDALEPLHDAGVRLHARLAQLVQVVDHVEVRLQHKHVTSRQLVAAS